MPGILIVGIGNILKGDEGFGPEVAKLLKSALADGMLPSGVKVVELPAVDRNLVAELSAHPYDALIVVDTVHRSAKPGTLYVLQVKLPEVKSYTREELREMSKDESITEPSKAFGLAKALKVLPEKVYVVGCVPETCSEVADLMGQGLSLPVRHAVKTAVEEIQKTVRAVSHPATFGV